MEAQISSKKLNRGYSKPTFCLPFNLIDCIYMLYNYINVIDDIYTHLEKIYITHVYVQNDHG